MDVKIGNCTIKNVNAVAEVIHGIPHENPAWYRVTLYYVKENDFFLLEEGGEKSYCLGESKITTISKAYALWWCQIYDVPAYIIDKFFGVK